MAAVVVDGECIADREVVIMSVDGEKCA